MKYCWWAWLALLPRLGGAQALTPVAQVNVFLGSSGDHGQLSPAASYLFSMVSLGPQTYPNPHTGYEHLARKFLGFTHNRFEGDCNLYNASREPWKSQALLHRLAVDTVVQPYFNDNSRGIDPYIGRIYQNQPQAYLHTMDAAGAMSAWYVLAACGLMPACVVAPVYYLTLPLFQQLTLQVSEKKRLTIRVENYAPARRYVQEVHLNGKRMDRNWLTHKELIAGGTLTLIAADAPNTNWGLRQQWLSTAETPN